MGTDHAQNFSFRNGWVFSDEENVPMGRWRQYDILREKDKPRPESTGLSGQMQLETSILQRLLFCRRRLMPHNFH